MFVYRLPPLNPCDLCQTIPFTLYLYNYRKIPKISTGTYIFQMPFLRGLFLKGLIFGGVYVRRKICVSKSTGLALFFLDNNMGSCSGKEKSVESKTRYQIFLCLLSSHLLFLFPQYRVLQYVL